MASAPGEQDELLQKLRYLVNASGEKEDEFGSEMADDARVWRVYVKAARKHDGELLAQWNGTLDTLLIFAGLFSAVSTTFIIDSYKQMQPDYAQETFKLLLANVSGTRYVEPSGRVGESARALNCLWISSLIASLSTALIAILAKQWLASYPVSDRENLREWAQLRQYRFDALESWHLPVLIAVVPVLLHVSLMLFLAGLVVFLWDIDTGTMVLALALSAGTYGLYGFTTLSPVLWSSSPFRTPLTPVLQRTTHHCVKYSADAIGRLYHIAKRAAGRFVSSIRVVLAAVACHPGVETSSPATSTIYRLCYMAVHAVTRSVVTVMDRIYCLYCMAVRISRRCVDSLLDKVLTAVISPTGVILYSLAMCTILWFVAVFLAIDTLAFIYRFCYMAVRSRTRNMFHRLARGTLSRPRPSALPVDPWITQTVFSDNAAAGALSWLGLHAEVPDIYYAVLFGLGDAIRGATVVEDLAPALRSRIGVQTSDLLSARTTADLQVVIPHLRAAYYLPSLLSSRGVLGWTIEHVKNAWYGRPELLTRRDYDTLLRAFAISKEESIALSYVTQFFGTSVGQKVCESPSSILPSTVHAIVQLYIYRRKIGGPGFRSSVLTMLNALRPHFVASPDLAAKLLGCMFADEDGPNAVEGPLIAKHPDQCGRTFCESMGYLVAILARYDFRCPDDKIIKHEVAKSLKSRTFETYALFCRRFSRSRPCRHLGSNLSFWLSKDEPLSRISPSGRDVASFVSHCSLLDSHTRMRMIRRLLHPHSSWCASDSSDPDRGVGLNVCLHSILRLFLRDNIVVAELRILLDDACLEPLQRATGWDIELLSKCARNLSRVSSDGSNIALEDLVSKFIFFEVKDGPENTTIRTWDLVAAGSQRILALAQSGDWGNMYGWNLCDSLRQLCQRYPDKPQWKEMGVRVRLGSKFFNDPAWRARNSEYAVNIQKTIEEFCSAMDPKEGRPETHSSGPQALAASRTAADGSNMDTDTAHKFLEWQVDGAY